MGRGEHPKPRTFVTTQCVNGWNTQGINFTKSHSLKAKFACAATVGSRRMREDLTTIPYTDCTGKQPRGRNLLPCSHGRTLSLLEEWSSWPACLLAFPTRYIIYYQASTPYLRSPSSKLLSTRRHPCRRKYMTFYYVGEITGSMSDLLSVLKEVHIYIYGVWVLFDIPRQSSSRRNAEP